MITLGILLVVFIWLCILSLLIAPIALIIYILMVIINE